MRLGPQAHEWADSTGAFALRVLASIHDERVRRKQSLAQRVLLHGKPYRSIRRGNRAGRGGVGRSQQSKTMNKKKIGASVGIALVPNLAQVAVSAEDTGAEMPPQEIATSITHRRPDRPPRPEKAGGPKVSELKQIIRNFAEQKNQFLKQQKEMRHEQRGRARELVVSTTTTVSAAVQEARGSVIQARERAREQARKLVEEARNAAKMGRKRD